MCKISANEIGALDEADFLKAVEFNRFLDTVRAPIEQCIGGSKRGSFSGDRAKIRMSLKNSTESIALFDELAVYLHAAIMRMRGQVWQSNSAVLSMEHHSHIAKKIINEQTGTNLFTFPGRKSAFHGSALHGMGNVLPPILPL